MKVLSSEALSNYFIFCEALKKAGFRPPELSWGEGSFSFEWDKGSYNLKIQVNSKQEAWIALCHPLGGCAYNGTLENISERFQELHEASFLDWMKESTNEQS